MQARRCCGCRLRLPSPPPGYLRRLAPPASPPPTTSAWSRAVHRRRAHSYQTPAQTLIFRTYPDHLTPHTPHSILPPHYPTPHSPPTPPHPHTTHQPPRGPGSRARLRARARLGTRCHTPRRRGRAPLLPRSHGRRWYEACDPSTARTPAALAMCKACIRYTCAKPVLVTMRMHMHMRHCAGLPDRSGTHCITALAVNAGGTHAISAAGGVLRRWDLHTGGVTAEALHAHRVPVCALALDADGSAALSTPLTCNPTSSVGGRFLWLARHRPHPCANA
jgi:hypothetical protein